MDADADERTSGKIDASAASFNVAEFKYAVKVTPEEGEAITSDWTTVKVVDAEKATEVTEFGLDNDLDFVAMGDTDVKIKATEVLNGLGKKVEADKLPEVDTVKSSNIAVAQYDDGIKTNGVGTVTFTVKFENIEEEYSLTVEVKEARKATSIENEDIKIEAANDFEFENDFAIVVLDQYGKEFTVSGTLDILVKDSEGEVVEPGDSGKYNLLEEDVYTVAVSLGETKLGSFTIETVAVVGAEIDEYKLVFDDAEVTELDINPLLNPAENELTLAIEGYIKGVKQTVPTLGDALKAKPSDEDIATLDGLKVTGKAAGTVTISLYTVEGDLETTVATIDVVVNNTTPQITDLQLASNVKKLTIEADDDNWRLSDVEQLVSKDLGEYEFKADMVASIIFSEVDGTAIVTLTSEFGGESFTFDAELAEEETEEPGEGNGEEDGDGNGDDGDEGSEG